MTYSLYPQLLQQIVIGIGLSDSHNQTLNLIKQVFKNVINSSRKYEQITTVGQLLKVLEIRDALSENNVESLKEIAQFINNNGEILRQINIYENTHRSREYRNFYDPELAVPHNISKPKNELYGNWANGNPYHPYLHMSSKKKQRICEIVIEQIGTFWRDLARNLKIRECTIEKIDKDMDTLHSKASKLLEIYEDKADPQRWLLVLCDALERARRKDLAKSIQDIMLMNI
ncbi:fas-associated death domain protein-like [Aphomia sociella]